MKYNRFRKERKKIALPEVTLTPLIDTALTLLVIFMITTPMMNNAIKVQLPTSQVNEMEQATPEETIVFVDVYHKLYLNGVEMSLSEILQKLKSMAEQRVIDTVYVKADQAVEYGSVINLVDTIKMAGGIKYVALATKRAV